jgi:RNA polymerase sigma-70 factor (ECF subfamily)
MGFDGYTLGLRKWITARRRNWHVIQISGSSVEGSMSNVAAAHIVEPRRLSRALREVASVSARSASVVLAPTEANELIVRMARDSDRQAFAVLFAHYFPRVKAFLMRAGASSTVAEELSQETMLRVWRRAATFDPDAGAASTWIFVIARNLRVDRLRGQRLENLDLDPSDEGDAPPTGEMVALMNERAERVRDALASLSPEQAQIVRLFYFEERPHSEIARALGIPLGTVKSRVRLAVERLRAQLEDLG